jgi:hypothetical protein
VAIIFLNIIVSLFIDLNISTKIPPLMEFIYDHSSQQKAVDGNFTLICESATKVKKTNVSEFCRPEKITEFKQACAGEMMSDQMRDACKTVTSGKFEESCAKTSQQNITTNISQQLRSCPALLAKNITTRMFFVDFMQVSMPNMSSVNATAILAMQGIHMNIDPSLLQEESVVISNAWDIIAIKTIVVILFAVLLFKLYNNTKKFIQSIAKLFMGVSSFFFVAIGLIHLYATYATFDTTPVTQIMLGGTGLSMMSIVLLLLPVMLVQMFSINSVIFGGVCFGIAIALYVYANSLENVVPTQNTTVVPSNEVK